MTNYEIESEMLNIEIATEATEIMRKRGLSPWTALLEAKRIVKERRRKRAIRVVASDSPELKYSQE